MHSGSLALRRCDDNGADPLAIVANAIMLDNGSTRPIAREALYHAVTLWPDWDEPWLRLGQSFRAEGHDADAMAAYDAALVRNPKRIEALIARGVLALYNESPAAARRLLTTATTVAPDNHQAWHALGHACAGTGAFGAAIDAFRCAGRLAPGELVYALDLANLEARGDACGSTPSPRWDDGVSLALAGRDALQRGALDDAEAALEAASALKPDEPWILTALASVHMTAMRPQPAEPLLRAALAMTPNDPIVAHDLAVALARQYRYAEADAIISALPAGGPLQPRLLCSRANHRAAAGDLQGALDDIAMARSLGADEREVLRTECGTMPYRSNISAIAMRDAMTMLGAMLPRGEKPAMRSRAVSADDCDRPLRIGLLSNTLRAHPVGWLTIAGFDALDPDRFKLHCFGRYAPEDSLARRFAARVDGWHNIDTLDDHAAAILIAEQDIDILIDLGGYGDAGRMPVTAYRPAPVQIKWVGMQSTTSGVPAIDWFITDRWETPEGYEQFYTERLLRLTDGYVCYLPPPDPPAFAPPPVLAKNHITFGCFNNVTKITDDALRAWADLLSRAPNARLLLRCPQFSESDTVDRLQARARNAGLDTTRLDLLGRASHRAFLAGYNDIDIALDPFPYSGGLTTCESLFMGVPVVTLAGEHFAARHSVSHLSNVGLADCVTTSTAEYIERAAQLASDVAGLTALRAKLRRQVLASPLCDTARFGKSLGAALRFAWSDYCGPTTPIGTGIA